MDDRRGRSSILAPLLIFSLLVLGVPAQDLTASFDISGSHTARRFREFMADARAMLRVSDRPYVTQEAGRLPPQEDVPSRFMDLELRTASHAVTLRIRVDNLYAVGFRNGVGEGAWFELQHDNNLSATTLIDGSTRLSFGGNYRGTSNGVQNLGEVTRDTVIGRIVVEDAIDVLGSYNGTNVDDYSLTNSLRTLVVNFVEALRFTAVADRVATYMAADDDDDEPSGSRPNFGTLGYLESLIHSWGYLSSVLYAAVTGAVQEEGVVAQRLVNFNNLPGIPPIHDASTLAQALGMVLLAKHKSKPRWGRSIGDNEDDVASGITLVEVMDVTVTRIDDEDPGDLYGAISIDDSIGTQRLFYHDRSDPQSVRPGEPALLTGPGRAMSAFDGFAIYVNLMDQDTDPSADDEVSSGVVVWNSLEATSDEYDVANRRIIDGAYGRVELSFAVMSNAAAATVEVVLLDSSEGTPDVYGSISADTWVGDSTSPMAISTKLLERSHDEAAGVEKGSAVPLHRKVVAVPLTSRLEINVDLLDRNQVFADEQIAQGTVSFQPRLVGEESTDVGADYGRVTVRVNWSTWFE